MVAVLVVCSCTKEEDGYHKTHMKHGYVDMGQAGKWATTNIGAVSIFESGDYYSWGEPWVKEYYLQETYTNGTEDIAQALWGGKWRLPTIEDWTILTNVNYYKWTPDLIETTETDPYDNSRPKIRGYYIESIYGPTSGNKIYLPAAGIREKMVNFVPYPGENDSYHIYCYYWSSTLSASKFFDEDCAYVLVANQPLDHNTCVKVQLYRGLPVRPVLGE